MTVRHHVGLAIMMRFFSRRVVACRPCGRRLIRSQTRRTLVLGWWGAISFFFNWFVLAANWRAARQLNAIGDPSLSGDLVLEAPRGFDAVDATPVPGGDAPKKKRRSSPAAYAVLGFVVLALVVGGWDATHHDHDGGHGSPSTVPEIQVSLQDGPFTAEDGSLVTIAGAQCTGDGDPVAGGWTHFDCSLAFDDGTGDEVLVHLLPNDEIQFTSAFGGT